MPPLDPSDPLTGAFAGELHGNLYDDNGRARAVTIGVVVCPGCQSLVFADGYAAHEARHNLGVS